MSDTVEKHHKETHGLTKYNDLTPKSIMATPDMTPVIKRIKEQSPEDYARLAIYIEDLDNDERYDFTTMEKNQIAVIMMQIDRFDDWEYQQAFTDLEVSKSTAGRYFKMKEYILNYLAKARREAAPPSGLAGAERAIAEITTKDGTLKLDWKKSTVLEGEFEVLEEKEA